MTNFELITSTPGMLMRFIEQNIWFENNGYTCPPEPWPCQMDSTCDGCWMKWLREEIEDK